MRNTERMTRELFAIFTVQFNTQSRNTVLSKMSYLLFISWRRTRCFEHYIVCTGYCLLESQNLSKHVITCQSNLPFCVDKEKGNPAKPHRDLPQASHGIRLVLAYRLKENLRLNKANRSLPFLHPTCNRFLPFMSSWEKNTLHIFRVFSRKQEFQITYPSEKKKSIKLQTFAWTVILLRSLLKCINLI